MPVLPSAALMFGGLFLLSAALIVRPADTLPFVGGNLVVCRVGDGHSVLGNGATAVFIDEFTPTGAFVRSIALPTTVVGNNKRLTVAGNSVSECQITRSTDGRYLMIAGYDAPIGTLSLAASPSTTNARVIGRIDPMGAVDTTTALSDAISEGSVRGSASTNGTDLWISGNGTGSGISGVWYAQFGAATSTPLLPAQANLRAINIFGGQLFASLATGSTRLATVGAGTPSTSGQSLAALSGVPGSISPNGFFLADLSSEVVGLDTLYVADDVGGVVRKYSFSGTSWTAKGMIAMPAATGLAGKIEGSSVTLYATNSSSLEVMTDSSGYNATISGTLVTIASPPDLTQFRSVAFAPVSMPAVTVNWGLRGFVRIVTISAVGGGAGVKRIYFRQPYADDFQFIDGNSVRVKVVRSGGWWSIQAFAEDTAGNRSDVAYFTIQ